MPLLVYLIRHGETAWSLSGQHTGRTEVTLTARGEEAACNLGTNLRDVPFTHVLVSPRQRAWNTCELAGQSPLAERTADLAEWDYGTYEGQLTADIQRTRPNWDIFHDGCPGGESPEQILHRADRLIAQLKILAGNIALFTHGHFGRVLGARWIGLPVHAARHFVLGPASLSVLGYEHHCTDRPAIVQWNNPSPVSSPTAPDSGESELKNLKKRALDRWENEGGEIPHVYPNHAAVKLATVAAPPPTDRWPTSW